MLKSFDVRVQSRYSDNWYDSFRVDTVRGVVYFHQCDARRNGQVARYIQITFHKNGAHTIEARSAKGSRYEQFGTTQCLKLALRLLQEVKAEARQVESVKVTCADLTQLIPAAIFGLLTLMVVYFGITLGAEEYLTVTRVVLGVICGLLSMGFFYNAFFEKTSKPE